VLADAGIPMLPLAYPVIVLFLVLVIAIESLYIRFRLGTGWRNTLAAIQNPIPCEAPLAFAMAEPGAT
jgi:hypothetical protein